MTTTKLPFLYEYPMKCPLCGHEYRLELFEEPEWDICPECEHLFPFEEIVDNSFYESGS